MENKFYISAVVCLCYFILSMLEMKVFNKELLPIKELVQNIIIVFISALGALYLMDQFSAPTVKTTEVFTSTPDF